VKTGKEKGGKRAVNRHSISSSGFFLDLGQEIEQQ
jgi:hypothetical protein